MSPKALELLIESATNEQLACERALAQALGAEQAAKHQLAQLTQFRDGYDMQRAGVQHVAQLQGIARFTGVLDSTIDRAFDETVRLEALVTERRQSLSVAMQRVKSLEKWLEIKQREAASALARREQLANDEMANRMAQQRRVGP
ncbi:MAG TPA: flagellar export protein FliJ [Burkholderiaceae bacterium]|nr:flagellar export protein FliJ [Burkholderiaceae bacterium]